MTAQAGTHQCYEASKFSKQCMDFKTAESEMHIISFLALAKRKMHPVVFTLNSLTCSPIHCWQSTSSQYFCWIFILLSERTISLYKERCSEDVSSLCIYVHLWIKTTLNLFESFLHFRLFVLPLTYSMLNPLSIMPLLFMPLLSLSLGFLEHRHTSEYKLLQMI